MYTCICTVQVLDHILAGTSHSQKDLMHIRGMASHARLGWVCSLDLNMYV